MRQQNFHKKPHTASFLQTFHTGQTEAQRRAGEPQTVAPEEKAAVTFVTGRDSSNYVAEYRGIKVTHGSGLITEPQAKYVVSIALDRDGVTEKMLESLKTRLIQGFAKGAASQFISNYKDLPRRVVALPPVDLADRPIPSGTPQVKQVAEGRYAVEEDGVLKFFRVSWGKGRWAGRVFLEIQASDDRYSIRDAVRREAILALIAANPEEAGYRYGRELGKCCRCGRTLTDQTSRDLGIGPDCRSK